MTHDCSVNLVGTPFGDPTPVRLIINVSGTDVLRTHAQFPGMCDEAFENGVAGKKKELNDLKKRIEG
jgi:hypothetical protein